jgi:hypothetical protein
MGAASVAINRCGREGWERIGEELGESVVKEE